jgi:uncharacterized protein
VMKINVSQLLNEAIGSIRGYAVDEELESGNSRIAGSMKLMRTDKGVLVSAKMSTDTQSTCSLCLKDFSQRIDVEFEEEAFHSNDGPSGGQSEAPVIDDKRILDLTEALEQYLYLALPVKPVCREDCQGICSQCGADLNETACVCDYETRDSPWAEMLKMAVSDSPDSRVN